MSLSDAIPKKSSTIPQNGSKIDEIIFAITCNKIQVRNQKKYKSIIYLFLKK